MYDLLYNTKMAVDRVKIVASKMLKDVARLKRKGAMVTQMLLKQILYNQGTSYAN